MSERSGENGHVSAAAYLEAEGAMWLATGEIHRDPTHPAAALLDRLEASVPVTERYDWLTAPRPALDGKSAFDLIDEENVGPVVALLDAQAGNETE